MKHYHSLLLLSVLLGAFTTSAFSQHPPCLPGHAGTSYFLPRLDSVPNGTSSMPFDVMMGYWVGRGVISYNNKMHWIKFFERRVTFDDTTKKMLHYYYSMVDYNPILFYKASQVMGMPQYIRIAETADNIETAIRRTSPNARLDYALCRARYILHIRADQLIVDTNTSIPKHFPVYTVKATVIDAVKGQVIPACEPQTRVGNGDNDNVDIYRSEKNSRALATASNSSPVVEAPATPNGCTYFHYAPSWGLAKPDGTPLMNTNQEYMVFLDIIPLCSDSTGNYVSLRPAGPFAGIYPIINGIVQDPYNELGVGADLTPTQYKQALRDRIAEIKSY